MMTDSRIKTARRKIGNGIPGVVYQWIKINCAPTQLLDFGCGYGQAKEYLSEFDWVGYDLLPERFGGSNPPPALYPIVAMSNVLNIQENWADLVKTLTEASLQVQVGGLLVLNYPANPRRMPRYDFEFMSGWILGALNHSFGVKVIIPKKQLLVLKRRMTTQFPGPVYHLNTT